MRRIRVGLIALAVVMALVPGVPATAAVPPGSWAPPRVLSDPEISSTDPRVVVHADGRATAVWRERLADWLVWSTRDASGEWSEPRALPGSTGAVQPSLVVDATGREVLVWRVQTLAGMIVRASLRSSGASWSELPAKVSGAWEGVRGMRALSTSTGEVVVIWAASLQSQSVVQSSSLTSAGVWNAPVTISQPGVYAEHVSAAVDGTGAVVVSYDCASCGIQATTRSPAGAWAPPVTLSDPSLMPFAAVAAAGSSGDAAVSWIARVSNGVDHRYFVQVARRRAGGAWEPPVSMSSPRLVDGAFVAVEDGTVHVIWGELLDGVPSLMVRRAVGEVWQPAEAVAQSDGLGDAYVVPTSDDDLVLLWQDATEENGSHLRSRTWSGGGWTPTADIATDVRTLSWAQAPLGEAMLVWEEQSMAVPRGAIHARVLDATPPVITSLELPAAGVAGTPVRMSVAATDRWSGIDAVQWHFPDGVVRSGSAVEHAFAGVGDQPVTVTVTDGVGRSTSRELMVRITPPPAPVASPPRLTRLDLSRHRIEIRAPRAKLTRTTVAVRLSADASVRFALVRKGSHKPAVRFVKAMDAGANRFRLTARVRGKTLRPGVYRLVARAVNDAGSSERRRVRLVVVR